MRIALLATAYVAVIVALVFARPHRTPGPPMRDFEAYYAAGAAWNAGANPYSQAIWNAERQLDGVRAQRYEALPFAGPPATLPLFGAIARMAFHPANVLWRVALIVSIAALALLTLRLSGRALNGFTVCAITVAALGFGPLTSALALGQLALPAFTFAVLALTWPPAGLLAWMQPNVALTLFASIFTRKHAFAFVLAAAAFGAACIAVTGAGGLAAYAAVLHAHASAERFSAIQITPAAIAYGFGASPALAITVGTLVCIAAIVWWAFLMRSLSNMRERFCATCALVPLAAPFFHEHDLLVVFVPAIAYATRATGVRWVLAVLGACLAATDWLGLAQRPDGTLQTMLLVGSFAVVLAAMHERPHARMLALAAAMIAIIGIAAVFAQSHAAPVWPDAMGPLPAGIAHLDIASAWQAQQRASGLFAPNGVWAALRAFSLLGCALIAGAMTVSLKSPADSRNPSPVPA